MAVFSAVHTVFEHTSHFSPPPPPKAGGLPRAAPPPAADARSARLLPTSVLLLSVNGFDIDERPWRSGIGTPPFPLESGGAT